MKNTPGPWKVGMIQEVATPAPDGLNEKQVAEWNRIQGEMNKPFRHNDGAFVIVAGSGDERGPIGSASFQGIAKRGKGYLTDDPVGLANAQLIAAAPDLKSALQDLLNAVESLEDYKLTRDLEPHKAQAVWDDAVRNAHSVIARLK